MWGRRLQEYLMASAVAFGLVFLPGLALGQSTMPLPKLDSDTPALLSADEVTYDESLGVATARGNVEISQGDRVLKADAISYNMRNDVVTASGNITLIEPSGELIFAEYIELTSDLKEGFIRDVRALLTDRSRLAAASGVRQGDRETTFRKAVFSPCELCRDDPTRAPLWQVKAAEVTHDQEERVIQYRDAWLEMFGVPILYTPYLEHPDPTVDRKSGFLAPRYHHSDAMGHGIEVPYFFTIGPDKDLTLAPIFTTEQGLLMTAEYRQIMTSGEFSVSGSATLDDMTRNGKVDKNQFRGHFFAEGEFSITPNYRASFDIKQSADDTYLREFDFTNDRTLTSRGTVEYFEGRDYGSLNTFLFDGQRAQDDDEEAPIVLPELQYSFIGEPDERGAFFSIDAGVLNILREEGQDSRRLSLHGQWEMPYAGDMGDLYRIKAALSGDLYWGNDVDKVGEDVTPGPGVNTQDGFAGRLFPQVAVEWRYPWVSYQEDFAQTLEPIIQVVASPEGFNDGDIPNEDSRDVEFDDSNLFSLNRFPGDDRVSSGSRVDYALRWTAESPDFGWGEVFFGQSFRFLGGSDFEAGSGLEDDLSDFVGRVAFEPDPTFRTRYRFRLDKDSLKGRRHDFSASIGPPAYTFTTQYTLATLDDTGSGPEDSEEIRLGFSTQINEFWSAGVTYLRDLDEDETRSYGGQIRYHDECFDLRLRAEREFFNDRDLKPSDTILFEVVFKHLGGVSS